MMNLIESLETRTFLTGHAAAAAAVIGQTSGVVASATNAPNIAVTQTALYFTAVKGNSNTAILRITNNGTANLDFKPGGIFLAGGARNDFTINNFPAEGLSLKPGRRLDLSVTYNAGSTDALGVKVARLNIISTDPKRPGITVALRALTTAGTSDSLEPSLQRVIDTFGLPIDVGDNNPDDYLLGTPNANSDEVVVQSMVKAGPGIVSIRPLALFGVASGPAVRLGIYSAGQPESLRPLWYVPQESAQSVSPTVYGQSKVDPGDAPFGIYTEWPGFTNTNGTARNVYSEDPLNATWDSASGQQRKMRFYPFVDQFGNAAPNTYLVAVEEFTQNYDYQDVLFIVTNVKPAEAKPTLAVTSPFDQPSNDRLVFNRLAIDDLEIPNFVREQQTLHVRNTGTQPLVVSFNITGNFSIGSGGGTNVTVAPGAVRNVVINFTATAGQAVHNGSLTITSNDPTQPTKTVALAGYWQEYSEQGPDGQTDEPHARTIINNLFGYQTVVTNPGQSLDNNGFITKVGDEILSPYWKVADDGGRVRVTQLASFHNQYYLNADMEPTASQSFVQWFEKGKSNAPSGRLFTHAAGDGQTVLPRESGNLSQVSSGSFNPGDKEFGFLVEGKEWSDPDLNANPDNKSNFGHFVRFFPVYDSEGKSVPNSYFMLHDYNREFTNYDFNDNIFLVENIKPVDAIKSPLTVFTEETSKGARISFTSPATGPKIFGFKVYRSTTARGAYSLLINEFTDENGMLARRPVTTFIDTSSTAADTFFYRIVSVGNGGAESAPVTVKI